MSGRLVLAGALVAITTGAAAAQDRAPDDRAYRALTLVQSA